MPPRMLLSKKADAKSIVTSARDCVPNQLSSDESLHDFSLANFLWCDAEDILAEQDHVSEFPGNDRSLFVLQTFCKCRTHGVGLDGLGNRQFLLWKPAIRILSIQGCARNRSVDGEHRIQRSNIPIRSKSKPHTVIQKCAECVRAAGAITTDACLGKATVIDRVIGLHRSDYVQFRESIKILCGHMLRVLDAEPAVCLSVRLHNL